METIDVRIEDVVYRGRGLARMEGLAVFVPAVLTGEKVRVRITKRHKNYAEAETLEILEPSPKRIAPACPLHSVCPGCRYQHVAYEEEIRLKQAQLENFLTRAPAVGREVFASPTPSPEHLGYRNKIVLHASVDDDLHAAVLGYFAEDNRSIFDVENCPLALPELNALLQDSRNDASFMRSLRPRTTVTLRHTTANGPLLWKDRPGSHESWLTEQSILGPLLVPRGSFYQVNRPCSDLLLSRARTLIDKIRPQACIDLFCGAGAFGLLAAACGVPAVLGVDSDRRAIRAAHRNALDLGLKGVDFIDRTGESVVRDALAAVPANETLLVADPPRSGLPKNVLGAITKARPADLLYVSCAADTLTRDLTALRSAGYDVAHCELIDMFPRTPLFESVTHLTVRPGTAK